MRKGMVSVRFTPEEEEQVRRAAEKEGVSLSEFLRRALARFRPEAPRRVQAGMSQADRERFRAEILAREIANAHERARHAHRSMVCSGYAGTLVDHKRCVGEQPRNGGCLCECHDRVACGEDDAG